MRLSVKLAAGAAILAGTALPASAGCGHGMYCSGADLHSYEGMAHDNAYRDPAGYEPGMSYTQSVGGSYSSPSSSSPSYDLGTTTVSGPTSHSSGIGAVDYSSGYSSPSVSHGGGYSSGSAYSAPSYTSSGVGISEAYTLDSPSHAGTHTNMATSWSTSGMVSGAALPGLGASENLCPVDCGTGAPAVGGKGKVLACYAVCQPKPRPVTTTTYTQVVRPVINVPYPVPYAVPYALPTTTKYSRYGAGRYGHSHHVHHRGRGHGGVYGHGHGAHHGYGRGYGGCAAKVTPHHGACR